MPASFPLSQQCNGLIIPGGESTVMLNQARNSPGLMPELQSYLQDPTKPVYGSCAGMILMASEDGVGGGKKPQKGLGALQGMNVWRNAYGGEPTVYSNCLFFSLNHFFLCFCFCFSSHPP
jgi:glutamine amidotransferase PdxT